MSLLADILEYSLLHQELVEGSHKYFVTKKLLHKNLRVSEILEETREEHEILRGFSISINDGTLKVDLHCLAQLVELSHHVGDDRLFLSDLFFLLA